MNVCLISNGYASKLSGGEVHFIRLGNRFAQAGHDVHCFVPSRYPIERLVKPIQVTTYGSALGEHRTSASTLVLFFTYCWRVLQFFRIKEWRRSGVIVFGSHLFHDVLVALFSRHLKRTYVVHIHHIIQEQRRSGLHGLFTKALEAIAFRTIRKQQFIVFTGSETVRAKLLDKYAFEADRVRLSKNGIDLDEIQGIPDPATKVFDIAFCGRLHKTKGILDFVRIAEQLYLAGKRPKCVVVGEGPEREASADLASRLLPPGAITFTGFVDEEVKLATLKSSRVFALPSHEEGWAIVIGEALACGAACVSYRLPDIVPIWGDFVAWVECFDKIKFAQKIGVLLESGPMVDTAATTEFVRTLAWTSILDSELQQIETAFLGAQREFSLKAVNGRHQ